MSELFCERFARLRKERGLTQLDVAKRLGITVQAIKYWEYGAQKPTTEKLSVLSRLLDVSLDMLLFGRETPQLAALHAAIQRGDTADRLRAMIKR